ncbi:Pectate lyase superfamily protein [Rhodobacteraceae bacterium THAF1]|uniref:glycosyl hydrolase family 28-related protein n=1 Tax=Palleronia sp. THAF1 TaxID=2587842 RepID=UPI000F3CD5CB|nr:glycosyl hydrolase family 28-related protein [Palleronia sp. THAF1]QFU07537.1 Pectate lyase superfamily protein [Palleronia sp. THAF1]VDC20500.1 Pectate lyase superfamily protein [Rhodobacteraceae bacterium THAF1]
MNKVITEGLVLAPTPFADGLDVYSKDDGTAGSATYAGDQNAAYVPADQDFGGALELRKVANVQRVRYMGRTPILPGTYLRVTARMRVISGSIPTIRIGGTPARGSDIVVGGLPTSGPSVTPQGYGEVVEVSAIVGAGRRGGVDLTWGSVPQYGFFGIDLTGPNGGVVRIDDIEIEDVTSVFIADMLPIVDVRDYGAFGDGTTNDTAAFNAADADSDGREIIVPKGTYLLDGDVYIDTRIRFEGTIVQPRNHLFVLRKNFDLATYIDAFGDEVEAFKKATQALLGNSDHESLDMSGRRVDLDAPIDMAEATGRDVFEIRRVIRNGQFNVKPGPAWDVGRVTSPGSYDPSNAGRLTNVNYAAQIEIGSHVTGAGVGREVYVKDVNVGAKIVYLSQPLYGGAGRRTFTFSRYRYVLDFGRFTKLSKFTLDSIDFQMDGRASGIMMAQDGETFHLRDCHITKPSHRGLTSFGRACQDLQIDRCHFISAEQDVAATQRVSVGFNVNANDAKIRDSRFQRLGTTMVLNGAGHLIVGNHWFQGDNLTNSPRTGGIVLTQPNVKSVITGNYLDNSSIIWTNEHDAYPDFNAEFTFGGLSVTGNIFTANDTNSSFAWIIIKPYGPGHYIQGLSVTGNVFRSINGSNERVETVDTSIADLDRAAFRTIEWTGNTFNNVNQATINPVTLEFTQNSAQQTWTLAPGGWMPFNGWTRTVPAIAPVGRLRDNGGATLYEMPACDTVEGSNSDLVRLHFSKPAKGKVQLTVRCDKPY